jgi:hypothetical protein
MQDFVKAYKTAVDNKDRKAQNMLVNALVTRDAKYATTICVKDAGAVIARVVTTKKCKESVQQKLGITRCEAEGKAGGEASLERGLKRGDVYIDDQGFFVFRRRIENNIKSTSDDVEMKASGSSSVEDIAELAAKMMDDISADWSAPGQDCGDAEVPGLKVGASDRALKALQEAYDTMAQIIRKTKENARELAQLIDADRSKDPLGILLDTTQRSHRAAKNLQAKLDELDEFMVAPRLALSDATIKAALSKAAPLVAELTAINTDLKATVKAKPQVSFC